MGAYRVWQVLAMVTLLTVTCLSARIEAQTDSIVRASANSGKLSEDDADTLGIRSGHKNSDFLEDQDTDYSDLVPTAKASTIMAVPGTDLKRVEDGYVDNQMAPGAEPHITLEQPAGAVGAPMQITVEQVGSTGDKKGPEEKNECPKGCSGHGKCVQYKLTLFKFCECEKGYEPPDCYTKMRTKVDRKYCPKSCMGKGTCYQYEDSEHYFCECQEGLVPPFCLDQAPYVVMNSTVDEDVVNNEHFPRLDFSNGAETNGSALVLAPQNGSSFDSNPTLVRMTLRINNTHVGSVGGGNATEDDLLDASKPAEVGGHEGHEAATDSELEKMKNEPSDDRILVTNLNHALYNNFNNSNTQDRCDNYGACSTCIEDMECGWCASTGKCFAGKEPGSDAAKTCGDYRYTTCEHTKGECGQFKQCGSCVFFAHCGWCASSNECMEGSKLSPTGGLCANWHYGTCASVYLRSLK